jgi:hypothetical protein
MPPADAVTDVIPAYNYAPTTGPQRERRPVPWRAAAVAVLVVPALAAWVVFCVKVIWVVLG